MPSRRIPQSHIARRKAIRRAFNKGKNLSPTARPFPAAVWEKLDLANATSLASRYFAALKGVDSSERALGTATEAVELTFPKLTRCISHFFQVLDFAIEREIWPPSVREYHGRDKSTAKLPPLDTHDDAIEHATAIIDGEGRRQTDDGSGHKVMALPDISEVTTNRDAFVTARDNQSPHKDALVLAQAAVEALMSGDLGVTRLIEDLYDETEHTYRHLEDAPKRTICHEWGILYDGDAELPEEEEPDPTPPPSPPPTP